MERTLLMSKQLEKLSLTKCESQREQEGSMKTTSNQVPLSATDVFRCKVLRHLVDSAEKQSYGTPKESSSGVSFSEMMSEASKISQQLQSG